MPDALPTTVPTLTPAPRPDGGSPFWNFGVNTCHAPLLLRDDLMAHVHRAREELGMRHVRCHGLLSDGMGVVPEAGCYAFERVFAVFDRLLDAGLRPFVELSAMPGVLARGDASVCQYRFRSDPPKDFSAWRAFIDAFARAVVSGRPPYATRALLEEIEAASCPDLRCLSSGEAVTLPPGAVALFTGTRRV